MHTAKIAMIGFACLLIARGAAAEDVRYYDKDGVTYRETRRIERRPVAETHWEERRETVYNQQYTTEMRDSHRTVLTPVTEYRVEPRWHGLWNPLTPPYVAYHMKPTTRWETRTETVRTPVTVREVVPETRIVRVPVRSLRFVEEETISRVALVPAPSTSGAASVAGRVGGISRMESDPPKQGVQATPLEPTTIRR